MQDDTGESISARRWYVAYTAPRREACASEQLARQGYRVYLPLYGGLEPLFPRYLFFRPAHASQSIAPVRSTRGVQSIVRFGALYASVSPELIQAIREQEFLWARERDAHRPLRPGQRVRVQCNAPALAGMEGLVQSAASRRVVVLMDILGRQTPVRLPSDSLEAV